MPRRRFVAWIFPVGLMVLGAGMVSGQDYPNKPIRIVTGSAGGDSDFSSRFIAQGISGPLGQQVIVENRGGGILQGQVVSKSPPDGYTLLVAAGSLWIGPLLRDTPYDPVRDFSPISMISKAPNVLAVHPSLPVKSVKELITLARAKPGALNYSSGATGSSSHLSGELFKVLAGVNMVRIPYKGTAPALNDLIAGQVHLMFPTASAVAPHLKSGRLRALGVTSAEPSVLFPGLPAVAATGLSGYEAVSMTGMFAPAGTPAAIISRLNREIVRVLNTADVKEKLLRLGVEPVGSSPEEFAAKIKSEMTRLGKVIRDAGVRGE